MTWRSAAASSSLHATQRADELMAAGDMEGRRVWHRIDRALDPVPHGPAFHVAGRQQVVRALGGM